MDRTLLDEIAAATRLKEGAAGVEAIVRAVHRGGTVRLQDAARAARLPLPLATAVRRELERRGVLTRDAGLTLSKDGRDWAEGVLGLKALPQAVCGTCGGHGIVLEGAFRVALERLEAALAADEPPTDVTLDQAPCTAETAIRRVALMLESGTIEGRRVLMLGDDDSVSLAIGFVGQAIGTPLARSITVVELDPGRAAFIERVSAAEGFDIRVVRHDLRRVLPTEIFGGFDVVETDPPYTLEGARLFLTRAREALDGGRGDIVFSFAHWPPGRTLDLMELFLELGLAVRSVRPGFNAYRGASVLAASGQLFELTAARPVALRPSAWEGPLYTAETNPRERSYTCTKCRAVHVLGERGTPPTIEALKVRGCRSCGNHRFARVAQGR